MNQTGLKNGPLVMSAVNHVGISAMTRLIRNRYITVGYHQLIDSGYEMKGYLGNETRNA